MPTSLQQTNLNPPKCSSFQYHHHTFYAPTSGHVDSERDHFDQQIQETIDQTPEKDILVVQVDWNAKVTKDAQADLGDVCGPYCNVETNDRGLRLLESQSLTTYYCQTPLVLTNHPEDGHGTPQPD